MIFSKSFKTEFFLKCCDSRMGGGWGIISVHCISVGCQEINYLQYLLLL